MVRKLKDKERRLIIRILRVILIIFAVILVFLLLLTAYLFIDRDNIAKRLLLSSNNYTHGELSFEGLTFNPFRQFPYMSMKINETVFYENPLNERNQNEVPLMELEQLYVALDVLELLSGRVEVAEIILDGGRIHLIQYPDSTLNLLNSVEMHAMNEKERDSLDDQSVLELNIDRVIFNRIGFSYENRVDRNSVMLDIRELNASLGYTPQTVRSILETEMSIESMYFDGRKRAGQSELQLLTSFEFSREDHSLVIDPSSLAVNKARLTLEGNLNFSEKGSVDLKIDGSDNDFSFFSIFMSEAGLRNIERGDLYFRGTVKNNEIRGLPQVNVSFGLEKVRILIPRTAKYINDLNLSGRFNSGKRPDLSAAWLMIDTVYAELPDGFLNGRLSARNLVSPEVDLSWRLKANLSGFDQVFELPFMDSLEGVIEINIGIEGGKYYPEKKVVTNDKFSAKLDFDEASLIFPGIMSIRQVNGQIRHVAGVTGFQDFNARVDDSDFLINGTIRNTFHILFNLDTTITADLEIRSDMFDLPGFLDFVPEVRQSFPYRIRDLALGVSISTTTKRFLEMRPNPSITFEINYLNGEIEDLLPPLRMSQGLFELHHRYERTYLNFEDFKINIADSDMEVDLEFISPEMRRNYLVMNMGVVDLNPAKLLPAEGPDSIPEFLDGLLSGSFRLDLHFPHDSLQTLKKIDLRDADLQFINSTDTIITRSLHILAEDIYIDPEKDPNPFATLSADMTMGSDNSRYNSMSWEGYDFDVEARDGVYTVYPGKSRLFGKEGKGLYLLDPFSENPNYKIQYEVEQYEVKDLMGNFMKDSLLLGKMDIKIDMSLVVPEDQQVLYGLNGDVLVHGNELTLYGIELDKLIRKFERSQNFNLVDLGAIMFMGPAGLAVSKGSSYANIIASDYSENSRVREIVSEFSIENGRVMLNDLAFSTEENRVAAKGWIDIPSDSLDIVFAVVDKNGCSIIEQQLFGSLKKPQKSNIRFFETIIAPLTNLVQAALGSDCKAFYSGSVKHPEKK